MRLLLVGFLFQLSFTNLTGSSPLLYPDLVLKNRYQESINKSLEFFMNRQKRDGSFIYDHFPFQGRTLYKGNWVRQAGALLSMAFAYQGKNKKLKSSIDRALSFFQQNTIAFERDGIKMRIISENHEGLTGTICLFLSAYFHLHHNFPTRYPIDSPIYQELMDTLAYYHHVDEGLTSYINTKEAYIEKHRRDSEIYASAQHFLLLAMYHRVFKRPFLHPSLLSYLDLYDREWTYGELAPSYHWVMLALSLVNELNNPELEPEVAKIAGQLQLAIDRELPLEFQNNNYCARVEGLGSYLVLKQERGKLDRRELYELSRHLRHLKNFQLEVSTKKKAPLPSSSKKKSTQNKVLVAQKTPAYSV
ncbi:hypothetical protein HOF92_16385, partial [bacterium]|nr:hypothetical protein [bacterium]